MDGEVYRQRLLDLRAELVALDAMAEEATQPVQLDQQSVGRLSRMDAMLGQQMALETQRRRQQQRQLIDAALRRIEAGDFGDCLACGEPIDPRRLEVDPAQSLCFTCASRK